MAISFGGRHHSGLADRQFAQFSQVAKNFKSPSPNASTAEGSGGGRHSNVSLALRARRCSIRMRTSTLRNCSRSSTLGVFAGMVPSASSWWSKDTVAVVTGANKGIGFEIVRALADQGLTVVLTARDQARGQAAVESLKAAGLKSVWFHQLDILNSSSLENLATWLKQQFGGIDILVNNAAILSGSAPGAAGMALSYENAKQIVDTNYYSVKNVTEGLLPLLRSSPSAARIVIVTSRGALYERLGKESLKQLFRNEETYSTELADSLATKYLEDVKAGRFIEEGWLPEDDPGRTYCESKMFLSVYAIALAKALAKSQPEGHQIWLSSFCPGVTQTDMLKQAVLQGMKIRPEFKLKTPADGAETGVWLTLLSNEELAAKAGKFYGEREEYPFSWKNSHF